MTADTLYCEGIRLGDLCHLTWSNIRSGRTWYAIGKTERLKQIRIVAPREAILDSGTASGAKSGDLILPSLEGKDISTPQ